MIEGAGLEGLGFRCAKARAWHACSTRRCPLIVCWRHGGHQRINGVLLNPALPDCRCVCGRRGGVVCAHTLAHPAELAAFDPVHVAFTGATQEFQDVRASVWLRSLESRVLSKVCSIKNENRDVYVI